ncbi:MAG: hypothetical protein CMJ89_10955 [Planctomycetes bacterium]|jgi:tetratricopeptide (TPR) repeat protein|nr:hypothetical protein [Planctomycetota bacterium]
MSSPSAEWWVDDLQDVCIQFQLDLSCLVDGELDEVAGGRAIAHLEECASCSTFFNDARSQIRAQRDLSNPEALLDNYSALLGTDFEDELDKIDLVHRLSTIFYQLGKAYVLTAIDPDFRVRVFEQAVEVGGTKTHGRGFVDGVLESGRGQGSGLDWQQARHLLNGKLEKIVDPLEKGRRLLEEAVKADGINEEARLYLAFLDAHEGRRIKAAGAYRRIFQSALVPSNRAHAAVQLGKLYAEEGETRKAIACNRWIVVSGIADGGNEAGVGDDRFFFAHFNIGMYYAGLGDLKRSLAAYRCLLDRHPARIPEIAQLFLNSPRTRAAIDHHAGFAQALFETCPELFSQGAFPPLTDVPLSDEGEVTS